MRTPARKFTARLHACAILIGISASSVTSAAALMLDRLKVPDGFSVAVFSDGVADARQMARGTSGVIYVGSRRAGSVYAVVDGDGDKRADHVHTIATGLYMPSGVAYHDGTLYVAEVNRVIAFDAIDSNFRSEPKPRIVFDRLPADGHHGWKFIAFGPDNALYIPVGAPCNVCEVEDPYGTILRLDVATGKLDVVARGIRNSVGFDWHPRTQELWFSDNGRDMMGDEVPPEEINRISQSGQHFGFPYVHGGDIPDPEFGTDAKPASYEQPAWQLGAHVAPLGVMFYTGREFPEEYRGSLLVAEHGSWNRSRKAGYRVMRAIFDADGAIQSYVPFITGWLQGEANWGRPVDIEQLADGSVLVSDDQAGVIYRISYAAP